MKINLLAHQKKDITFVIKVERESEFGGRRVPGEMGIILWRELPVLEKIVPQSQTRCCGQTVQQVVYPEELTV